MMLLYLHQCQLFSQLYIYIMIERVYFGLFWYLSYILVKNRFMYMLDLSRKSYSVSASCRQTVYFL